MAKKTARRILLSLILILFIGVPVVMAAAWIGTETVVERTSGAEFCARCHTMEPFAESHANDVHGGDNPGGVVATCADCHLPHDSAANHLVAKVRTGLRDAWAQAIYLVHKPDWIGNLEHRERYVYDSGCLNCHRALEKVAADVPAAGAAHRLYFESPDSKSCVGCHQQVGHEDLKTAIAGHFDEVTFVVDESGGNEKAHAAARGTETGSAAPREPAPPQVDEGPGGSDGAGGSGGSDDSDGSSGSGAEGSNGADGSGGSKAPAGVAGPDGPGGIDGSQGPSEGGSS